MFTETKFFHKAGEGSGGGGGGGSDPHNKGSFLTPEALRTAYPTAEPGDFAIVESTDTVWVWDSDGSDWKDGDTKGQVTSVNNQTGAVTVQETLVSGTNIKTVDGNSLLGSGNLELSTYLPFPTTWTTTGTTKALCDDIAADTTAIKGKAYLGEVTCNDLPASMANAEIVAEIMDGTTAANKVIVLTLTSGNTAPYMWKYTYWDNGNNVSGWQTWATSAQGAKADTAVQPGDLATVATTGAYSDLTGTPTIPAAIQVSTMPTAAVGELGKVYQFIGTTDANYTHGYFYECVSDGQTPATYSWTQTNVQPQAGGLPSQTGQSGKFLTTDGTDASWSDTPLVNKSTAGYGLTILGNRATSYSGFNIGYNSTANGSGFSVGNSSTSYTDCVAVGPATIAGSSGNSECVAIGPGAKAPKTGVISIGYYVNYNITPGQYSVAIGRGALTTGSNCCLINLSGTPNITNADSNTVKIANTNGNFEIMSADGTIPEARLADTTNATTGDVLQLDSNGNAVWAASGGGGGATATTATLAAANWSSNSQTVSVTGVTASNVVYVMAAPASAAEYAAAGVQCTAQASGTLTFTCTTTPSSALTVNIAIF